MHKRMARGPAITESEHAVLMSMKEVVNKGEIELDLDYGGEGGGRIVRFRRDQQLATFHLSRFYSSWNEIALANFNMWIEGKCPQEAEHLSFPRGKLFGKDFTFIIA